MPELPEVETVRRGLAPVMETASIQSVELRRDGLRFPFPPEFAARLSGQRIDTLVRRAKFIVGHLNGGEALIMHLGMTGRFIVEREGSFTPGLFVHDQPRHQAHDHVIFHLSNGARVIYNDVRRFGFMDLAKSHALEDNRHFQAMGVEPLGNDFNAPVLAAMLRGRKTPLKAALLDQSLISGLGNIYVCEALHRSGLSPLRAAGTIVGDGPAPTEELTRLTAEIRLVLEEAIAAGGSTLRDFASTDGSLGYFQHTFRAYGQTGATCTTADCGGTIERIVQGGRSTFWCRSCQR